MFSPTSHRRRRPSKKRKRAHNEREEEEEDTPKQPSRKRRKRFHKQERSTRRKGNVGFSYANPAINDLEQQGEMLGFDMGRSKFAEVNPFSRERMDHNRSRTQLWINTMNGKIRNNMKKYYPVQNERSYKSGIKKLYKIIGYRKWDCTDTKQKLIV